MFKSKTAIALLFSITVVVTACSNDNHNQSNQTLQNSNDTSENSANDTSLTNLATHSTDFLLKPGEAAGKIKIDENTEEVLKSLGKPDSSDAAMQKMVAFWFDDQNGQRYSTAIYATRSTEDMAPSKVRQIRVTSPAFKTKDGLGVTSSLDDIKKVYTLREIKYPVTDDQVLHVWTDKQGIGFEIADDQKCSAVFIYKKGDELSPTYLPLR